MRRQGSQFTSTDFIKVLAGREIKISMDGKGAWRDNVFVERLWRTIKYEEVYLRVPCQRVRGQGIQRARHRLLQHRSQAHSDQWRLPAHPTFRSSGKPLASHLIPRIKCFCSHPDRFLIRLILDGKTPDQAYFNLLLPVPVAA